VLCYLAEFLFNLLFEQVARGFPLFLLSCESRFQVLSRGYVAVNKMVNLVVRRLLWTTAIVLLVATACGGAEAPAEATAVPQGMMFDDASQVYELVPGSSEARFKIGEILRGEPKCFSM
jgi:hypothetical protein